MKIFKKIINLFRRRKAYRLTVSEFDEMVDNKLIKVREFYRENIDCRDDNELFDKRFGEAYRLYENTIKKDVSKSTNRKITVLSPIDNTVNKIREYRRKKATFYWKSVNVKFKPIKIIRRVIIKFFNVIIRFRQQLINSYNIWCLKKLFPDYNISDKRAYGIINAVKLNKRMLDSKI